MNEEKPILLEKGLMDEAFKNNHEFIGKPPPPPKSGPCVDCQKPTKSHPVEGREGRFRCHVCHLKLAEASLDSK